jgi:hypothetical protein
MPAVLGVLFYLFLVFVAIAYFLPLLLISISGSLTGKQGKLDGGQVLKLQIWFYVCLGVFFGMISATQNSVGVFSFIFNFLFAFIIWPLGLSVGMLTGFGGNKNDTFLVIGCIFLAYLFVQMIAVKMILERSDRETNLN